MFFKKITEPVAGIGRVYVFKFTLDDGTVLHKVGLCNSSRSKPRLLEVVDDFFNKYRYIPRCEIRRDREFVVPRLIEKHLHDELKEWSYTFDKKFNGSTEFFKDLFEDTLLDYIDDLDEQKLYSLQYENLTSKEKTLISDTFLPAIDKQHQKEIPF